MHVPVLLGRRFRWWLSSTGRSYACRTAHVVKYLAEGGFKWQGVGIARTSYGARLVFLREVCDSAQKAIAAVESSLDQNGVAVFGHGVWVGEIFSGIGPGGLLWIRLECGKPPGCLFDRTKPQPELPAVAYRDYDAMLAYLEFTAPPLL